MGRSLRFRVQTTKLLFLTMLILVPSVLRAQIDTGSIVGVVRDPSGAAIAGATVTLKSDATGVTRIVSTNEDGGYQFAAIIPGTYSVQATAQNFESAISTHSKLTCNRDRRSISS